MSDSEYQLYTICEEYHKEIKMRFHINDTPIQLARRLHKKLTLLQINHILHDIYLIKKRGGNVANYYILLIYPFIQEDRSKEICC